MANELTSIKNKNWTGDDAGPAISVKMKAVMYVDSGFEGALKIFSNISFIATHEATIITKEKNKSWGVNANTLYIDNKNPMHHKKNRQYKTSRYIVILFKKLSIKRTMLHQKMYLFVMLPHFLQEKIRIKYTNLFLCTRPASNEILVYF